MSTGQKVAIALAGLIVICLIEKSRREYIKMATRGLLSLGTDQGGYLEEDSLS